MITIQKAVIAWAKMCETDLDRVTSSVIVKFHIRQIHVSYCPIFLTLPCMHGHVFPSGNLHCKIGYCIKN